MWFVTILTCIQGVLVNTDGFQNRYKTNIIHACDVLLTDIVSVHSSVLSLAVGSVYNCYCFKQIENESYK